MRKISVAKVQAWKGPDGNLYEDVDTLRRAVRRAVIDKELTDSLSGGEIWLPDVVNVVHNKWSIIEALVDEVMASIGA